VVSQSTWQWLDIHNKDTGKSVPECNGLAPNKFYWWWDWSRVVHDTAPGGNDVEVITESPAFSFILGDNHPHVMALPFVLVAATIALSFFLGNLVFSPTPNPSRREGNKISPSRSSFDKLRMSGSVLPDLLLTAIVAGGLSFMNTWDFPVYGALIVGGLLLHHLLARKPLLPAIVFSVAVFALGYVLYLPFYAMFSSQAKGIGVNAFSGTRPIQFFLMFATFVCAIPGFLWMAFREDEDSLKDVAFGAARLTAGLMAFVLGAAAIATLFWPEARAYAAELNANGSVLGVTRSEIFQSAASRLPTLITPALLLAVAAICGALVWMRTRRDPTEAPSPNSPTPFVLLLIMGGALLTALVEFIFLRDNFGTRMNTVFKFYYMAWVVWSLAGGYALMTFITRRGVLAKVSAGLVIFCMAAGLLYPIFAASSRTNGFKTTPTLDGAAFIKGFAPADAAAMDWLNKNVSGAPIILEAPGDKYASYKYEGRMSVFTGLPTLLGWGGHQSQWRGNYDEPARREPDIEDLFKSTDLVLTQSLLRKYNVQYVIIGETERQRYPAESLAKFDSLGSAVFKSGNTVVYRVK
jgi:YYY domain-containing protein